MARGRPVKRDEANEANLVRFLKEGCSREIACGAGRISEDTFARWMANYADFADKVRAAEAEYAQKMLRTIELAAKPRIVREKTVKTGPKGKETTYTKRVEFDWNAAKYWLSKRFPKEWGEKTPASVAVTTPSADGKSSVTVTSSPALTESQILTLHNDLLAQHLLDAGIELPDDLRPPKMVYDVEPEETPDNA